MTAGPPPAPTPLLVVQATFNYVDLGTLAMGCTVELEDGSIRTIEWPITILNATPSLDVMDLPTAAQGTPGTPGPPSGLTSA